MDMSETVELPVLVNPPGTDEAGRLGLDDPDPVVKSARIVESHITAWNDGGDGSATLYMTDGSALIVELTYEELTNRLTSYGKWTK